MPLRWLLLTSLAFCGCSSGVSEAAVRHDPVGEPVVHRAMVVRSLGSAPAEAGDDCSLEVTRVTGEYFNCRIRVSCHGEVLYGLPGAGYNRCELEGNEVRSAQDRNGTRRDGDPKLHLDLERGRVIVRDRAPDMELVLAVAAARPAGLVPEPPPGYSNAPPAPAPTPAPNPTYPPTPAPDPDPAAP